MNTPFEEIFAKITLLRKNIEKKLIGKPEVVDLSITTLLAGGHLLIEDVPGVGKTTMANALARSVNLEFRRIQFTSDLLPGDIIGVNIFNRQESEFSFVKGPIFSNLVLADEINRGTPKTQSALLEAMNEQQVSVDNMIHPLASPFMVIATQNPYEHSGTYPLPESQLDRFMMKIEVGYPSEEHELEMMESEGGKKSRDITSVLTQEELSRMQEAVNDVKIDDSLKRYLLKIVHATRSTKAIDTGVSPRGTIAYLKAVKAYALLNNRNYVIPDDIKHLAPYLLAHRIVLKSALFNQEHNREVVEEIVSSIPVPL